MEKFGRSNMDGKAVRERSAKSAHIIRGRDATLELTVTQSGRGRSAKNEYIPKGEAAPEPTVTQSGHSSRLMKLLTMGLALASPFSTASAQERHVPTVPNMRDSHGAELSQRGALHYLPESTDIASSSDSRRQYKNTGPNEFSRLRVGNVELRRPTANDVESILQDEKVQKEILSACQDSKVRDNFVDLAKKHTFMDSVRPMFLHEHFITFLSDLCQDSKVRDNFVDLAKKHTFMDSIRPLLNGKDFEMLKRILEARQEEAHSHNLDATQESFERQKGSARKLLYENSERDLAIEILREELQRSHNTNYILMVGVVAVAALGVYCYTQKKKELAQEKEAHYQTKMNRLQGKVDQQAIEHKTHRILIEQEREEIYMLKRQLQPSADPVIENLPDQTRPSRSRRNVRYIRSGSSSQSENSER